MTSKNVAAWRKMKGKRSSSVTVAYYSVLYMKHEKKGDNVVMTLKGGEKATRQRRKEK